MREEGGWAALVAVVAAAETALEGCSRKHTLISYDSTGQEQLTSPHLSASNWKPN